MKEGLGGLPPPPPLTGANAQPVQAPPNRPQQPEGVHHVDNDNDNNDAPRGPLGRNVYQDPDMCYVVFVNEPTDRQSLHLRSMEVNVVIPAVPRYMQWS
jgi:hypothetical protein